MYVIVARASFAAQTRRVNMAIRLLQQQRSTQAIISALQTRCGLSRRQAYRYLLLAQSNRQPRPVPAPRAVFTVSLPRRLIHAVRKRCRHERRVISQVVAELLEQWLQQASSHG
jgi:hypothetical protein